MNPLIEPHRAYTFWGLGALSRLSLAPLQHTNVLIYPNPRSLVSFGPKQRSIGEAAKTLETSNYKNTIGSLKRLVGRTLSDPDIAEVEKQFINAELLNIDGSVGVKVSGRKIYVPRSCPEIGSW